MLLSSTSERPSTAKTTQHPDPSIDPQVDPSHLSPHPSFPLCSSDLMSRSKYWSASGPSLLRSPSPPSPHGFNYDISKTSLLYRLSLICFWHLRTLSKNRTNERTNERVCLPLPIEDGGGEGGWVGGGGGGGGTDFACIYSRPSPHPSNSNSSSTSWSRPPPPPPPPPPPHTPRPLKGKRKKGDTKSKRITNAPYRRTWPTVNNVVVIKRNAVIVSVPPK